MHCASVVITDAYQASYPQVLETVKEVWSLHTSVLLDLLEINTDSDSETARQAFLHYPLYEVLFLVTPTVLSEFAQKLPNGNAVSRLRDVSIQS